MAQEEKEELSAETKPDMMNDVDKLQQELADARATAEKYLANWKRSEADLINYKRRSEQEIDEVRQYANTTLAIQILPVLDDLERALGSIPPELANHPWVEGVKLIGRKLLNTMETIGITQVKALGEPFDPRFHEAVMSASGPEGVVVNELQRCYKLHERVIRAAKVVVGKGPAEEKEA